MMRTGWYRLFFVSSGVGCLVSSALVAAVAPELDLGQLVAAADEVVIGHARSMKSEWQDGLLVTRYTFEVEDTLKGTGGTELGVVVPGGVDLKRTIPVAMTVPGAPSFVPNEHVVLMLRHVARNDEFEIIGFNQGRFAIEKGRVRWHQSGKEEQSRPVTETIDEFRQRVRKLIARPDAGANPRPRPPNAEGQR